MQFYQMQVRVPCLLTNTAIQTKQWSRKHRYSEFETLHAEVRLAHA